jgi:hypothetical protein
VTEFLVELYVSAAEVERLTHLLRCAEVAAELQRAQGVPVRLVRSILVPEEETCFVFYDAPSREAAGETARLGKLAFVCIAAAQTTEAET